MMISRYTLQVLNASMAWSFAILEARISLYGLLISMSLMKLRREPGVQGCRKKWFGHTIYLMVLNS